jgi:hypothetical protein
VPDENGSGTASSDEFAVGAGCDFLCGQLIEVVAEFPEELVIARGYAGVSDLIGSVEREF